MTSNTAPRTGHSLNRHMFIADNIHLLRSLDNDTIDLVVTDPPFGKGCTFTSGGLKPALTAEEIKQERNTMSAWGIHTPADARNMGVEWPSNGDASYDDIWTWQDVHEGCVDQLEASYPTVAKLIDTVRSVHSDSHAAYLTYIAVRLTEISRVLKPAGSIYLHCDHTASHYLKLLMDCIFGRDWFRNEIIWTYAGGGVPRKDYPRKHDAILRYAGEGRTFNVQRRPYGEHNTTGRRATDLGGTRSVDYHPDGTPINDWWSDIKPVINWSSENVGYPTQKPVALAERIITASSLPGDVVLDPFAGCAYVAVAAEGLGRQWIACDISVRAMTVVRRQFNKFRYSVDGGTVVVKKNDMDQEMFRLLADADVTIRGPGQLPERTDEDPAPTTPPLVLEEPDYGGQLYKRKEML